MGVCPFRACRADCGTCLPHTYGGLPSHPSVPSPMSASSPHAWGSVRQGEEVRPRCTVFPTHVRVRPASGERRDTSDALPTRVRVRQPCGNDSSWPMRPTGEVCLRECHAFRLHQHAQVSFHHAREGGRPRLALWASPHARGSVRFPPGWPHHPAIFPTHVGACRASPDTSPRSQPSPHAWGSALQHVTVLAQAAVFSARVGVRGVGLPRMTGPTGSREPVDFGSRGSIT